MKIQIKKKNYQRSIRSFIFLSIFLFAGAFYYGYTQYVKLAAAQDAVARENVKLAELDKTVTETSSSFSEMSGVYENEYSPKVAQINNVFPAAEDYTNLTISLEEFVNSLDTPGNPMRMDSVRYSASQFDAVQGYSILPFQISLVATRSNFEKFVTYIQTSGDLKQEVRLMEIKNFTMNFVPAQAQGGATINEPMLNVTLSLNAYYQKPLLVAGA